ncbi:uncharacterized protein V1518DRAFT_414379 [Limtongia smithiae]|uniref:uncharacterized protein n=1 Tax=Limtongia smithiae TaxID=1125753 RepID=UPI0034CE7F00
MTTPSPVTRVAVIGAGASGLVAAKALLDEQAFDVISVFERNAAPGGLWNYSDSIDTDVSFPSTNVSRTLQPLRDEHGNFVEFPGPCYEKLTTNVPASVMTYDLHGYSQDEYPLFIFRTELEKFLHAYSKTVNHLISYNTHVLDVRKSDGDWVVTVEHLDTGAPPEQLHFDAICISNGAFNDPYIPSVKGISQYSHQFPGRIIHAKQFRRAEEYANKTVVVVGNAASAVDIAFQLAYVPGTTVYKSVKPGSIARFGIPHPSIIDVDIIERFDPENGLIHLEDGTVLTGVDRVIYATGYMRTLPFLPHINNGPHPIVTDGTYFKSLYLHFIYIHDPTLVVLGVPRLGLPYRTSQAQACYIARVWSGRLTLPPLAIQSAFLANMYESVVDPRAYHDLPFPMGSNFCQFVEALCALAPGSHGMFPRPWSAHDRFIRKNTWDLKVAFTKHLIATGTYARTPRELQEAGLLGALKELTSAEAVSDFTAFGAVKQGYEYTEAEIADALACVDKSPFKCEL